MSEEIDFIHDLSGPISTLFLLIEAVITNLKAKGAIVAEEHEDLRSAIEVLETLKDRVEKRRDLLREHQGNG